jgi:hypothetical protein
MDQSCPVVHKSRHPQARLQTANDMGQSSSNTSLDFGSLEHVGLSSRRYNRKGFFTTHT